MPDVNIYAVGVCALSACAPAGMPVGEVTAEVNQLSPTGISSPWSPDPDPQFRDGHPNPGPCDQDPSRTHYLFRC